MSPAEQAYLATHGPAKHAATSRLIDDLMVYGRKLPPKHCWCDDGGACRAHQAIDRIVERAHATGNQGRIAAAVERLVRRLK